MICSSFSTEHGPAITPICFPPTVKLPALDHRRLGFRFPAGYFVRLQNGQHVGHAVPNQQGIFIGLPIVADHGDHGALSADDHVRLQA